VVEQKHGLAGREGMNQFSLPDFQVKDAARVSGVAVILTLTFIGLRSIWVRIRAKDVKCVADARAEVTERHGPVALQEAEQIVDSTLPIGAILNWPTHIPKEIN